MLIIAALQEDTDYIKEWLNNWSVILNVGKCEQISYGHNTRFDSRYCVTENDESIGKDRSEILTDFEVTFE